MNEQRTDEQYTDKPPLVYVDGRAWKPGEDRTLRTVADRECPPKEHHISIPVKDDSSKKEYWLILAALVLGIIFVLLYV